MPVAIAALIAWLRPATPFYMTYALLPFLAALGALGAVLLPGAMADASTSHNTVKCSGGE